MLHHLAERYARQIEVLLRNGRRDQIDLLLDEVFAMDEDLNDFTGDGSRRVSDVFGTRMSYRLEAAGIEYLHQITDSTGGELAMVCDLSTKAVATIREKLADHGLKLRGE